MDTCSEPKNNGKSCAPRAPIAKVADVIGDPCTLMIIRELLGGPKRFSELEASLAGISSRTLTNKLKKLQENEIVKQKNIRGEKPHAEYELTPKGLGLHGITEAMRKYGEKYLA